jgi:hypothetical protein
VATLENKNPRFTGVLGADDGTRTHDLLHGKGWAAASRAFSLLRGVPWGLFTPRGRGAAGWHRQARRTRPNRLWHYRVIGTCAPLAIVNVRDEAALIVRIPSTHPWSGDAGLWKSLGGGKISCVLPSGST